MAATLEAVRHWCEDITAVVTVADDGGSSGRLRRDLGIIAPGDLRRCLQALAPPGLLTETVGHRFERGELEGHPPGNVLLAGLLEQAHDPVEAVATLGRVMGISGRVFPACVEPVDLVADTVGGAVAGQVAVGATSGITALRWNPAHPRSPGGAVEAIVAADLVVLGPGSLYTSVLAAVVPDLRDAIAASAARVLYVANLSPQRSETTGYGLSDHLAAVVRHGVHVHAVLIDDRLPVDVSDDRLDLIQTPLRSRTGGGHDVGLLAGALERYAAVTVSADQ